MWNWLIFLFSEMDTEQKNPMSNKDCLAHICFYTEGQGCKMLFLGVTLRPFLKVWREQWGPTTSLSLSRSLLVAAVSQEVNKIIFPKLPVTYLFKSHLQVNDDEGFLLPTARCAGGVAQDLPRASLEPVLACVPSP